MRMDLLEWAGSTTGKEWASSPKQSKDRVAGHCNGITAMKAKRKQNVRLARKKKAKKEGKKKRNESIECAREL